MTNFNLMTKCQGISCHTLAQLDPNKKRERQERVDRFNNSCNFPDYFFTFFSILLVLLTLSPPNYYQNLLNFPFFTEKSFLISI